ncbi:MAG TPA: WhiB family transcriptional regulator [Acidimicrobiia bacterium]|nr:WhiB family transcriptional regulator [Acidimicrobiia bacterium]
MADVDTIAEVAATQRWRQMSACRDLGSTVFFAEDPMGVFEEQTAKAVCGQCFVIDDCLAYAITHNPPFGVWGGMTTAERRVVRRTWLSTMAS